MNKGASKVFPLSGTSILSLRYRDMLTQKKETPMSVARTTEISATSDKGFEDAIRQGVERASKTLHGIKGAWVKEQDVVIENNQITEYKVHILVTFVLDD